MTPSSRAMEGPFYPDTMPLDTDNDLLIVNDAITPAVGEITHLHGAVTTRTGAPLRNAFVEIWQCDTNQSYRHTDGVHAEVPPDSNFQGYGRFPHECEGGVLLPHHQAGPIHNRRHIPHPTHTLRRQPETGNGSSRRRC